MVVDRQRFGNFTDLLVRKIFLISQEKWRNLERADGGVGEGDMGSVSFGGILKGGSFSLFPLHVRK